MGEKPGEHQLQAWRLPPNGCAPVPAEKTLRSEAVPAAARFQANEGRYASDGRNLMSDAQLEIGAKDFSTYHKEEKRYLAAEQGRPG